MLGVPLGVPLAERGDEWRAGQPHFGGVPMHNLTEQPLIITSLRRWRPPGRGHIPDRPPPVDGPPSAARDFPEVSHSTASAGVHGARLRACRRTWSASQIGEATNS
jgi:hypothetical protein